MIGQILTDIVLASTPFKNLVKYTDSAGNTKYAFNANAVPQGVPLPAVSYKVRGVSSVNTKDNFSGIDKYQVQIDIYDNDYAVVNKIDGLLRSIFQTSEGEYTVTDFNDSTITVDVGITRQDETEDVYFEEHEAHARSTEYFIITNKQ